MKSRSRGCTRGALVRGGSDARIPPRVPALLPASGRAGVTVLAGLSPERLTEEEERCDVEGRLMPAEERLTSEEGRDTLPEDLVLPPDWRETLPVVERRFCVLEDDEGRDALDDERLDPELERETLPDERDALPEDLEALPEDLEALPEEERRFCVLTEDDGRDVLAEDLLTLEDGRETLDEDREALEEDLDTLPLERLGPEDERETLPEEECPALEDRETEDELLRLEDEDDVRPPPLRDWASAVPDDNASAATTAATQAILKIFFISAKVLLTNNLSLKTYLGPKC